MCLPLGSSLQNIRFTEESGQHVVSKNSTLDGGLDKEFLIFKGRRISIKLKQALEGETEKIFKGEIIDWDDNEGLTFLRFEDGEELLIPKSNIQSAKLYID